MSNESIESAGRTPIAWWNRAPPLIRVERLGFRAAKAKLALELIESSD
jgi:hypothetical protein